MKAIIKILNLFREPFTLYSNIKDGSYWKLITSKIIAYFYIKSI